MKIVYFNPVGTIGGAEMCLLDVLATVRSACPDWRLGVVLGADGPLRDAVRNLGVSATVLPIPASLARIGDAGMDDPRARRAEQLRLLVRGAIASPAVAAYLVRLRRWLGAESPDRIQTNGMKAHVLGAWAAPRGLPVVWHLHDYAGLRPVMGALLRGSARRGVIAVAVSRSIAADAERVLGASVPIRTISNAIDVQRFAPGDGDGAWLDAAAGLPESPPGTVRIGLVATFARWKGHEVFLEAAARIGRDQRCRFYVVGGPIYRSEGSQRSLEELREHAEELGLRGRLGFTGHLADPVEAYRALDVVVHASTRPEPFGRVIVEGMACGRAVIATGDDGGVAVSDPHPPRAWGTTRSGSAELFEDGISALGCPPGDSAALAKAIARLIADGDLRRRLGIAGRAAALNRFDRSRLADQWRTVYDAGTDET